MNSYTLKWPNIQVMLVKTTGQVSREGKTLYSATAWMYELYNKIGAGVTTTETWSKMGPYNVTHGFYISHIGVLV